MQVILGAGLSGLSLAVALVRAGVGEPIVVVDRRTEFGRDRTWCTWADQRTPFLDLARHRWHTWEVSSAGGTARQSSSARPYVHIASDDFYDAALEELDRAPQVQLRLGEQVLEVGDGYARTNRERLEGMVHDGLSLGSPALAGKEMGMWQTFRGWEVRTERPRFDPGVATLMDFRVPQELGVHFLYVLPYAADHALVEHTSFARGGMPPHKRERVVRDFIGCGYEVLSTERGRLPMTTARLPARRSERTTAIGIAGGALRPSSGYAFTRVQAHSVALAKAVAAGETAPPRAGLRRRSAMDRIFLQALERDPGAFPERFRKLVAEVPANTFARFMSDQSTPRDDARVMATLPPGPFALAAAQAILTRR